MRGKRWFILLLSLALVLLASSVGVTSSSLLDLESSTGNTFQAWTSRQWTQTTQADFDAGVLNNITSLSSGDVTLAPVGWGSYSAELLINPDAETGDTTGWTAVGTHTANFVAGTECQNCPSGGAPAGPRTGTYSFMWNTPTASDDWAYQEIDLFASGFEEKISAGEAQLKAGGYLVCGECNPNWDRIQMRILLYDSGHSLIETSYDSGQLFQICSWSWYGITDYDIPTNARYVRIEFQTIEPPSWGAGKADDFTVKVRVKDYYSSGTIESQVLDTGIDGDRWDALFWDETLPSGSSGTETLRPNASGTYTQCAGFGDSPNYRCVDDVTPDENATYVWPGTAGERRDTYATEDSSVGTGTINSVTLYFRARLAGSCPTHTANTQLLTHSTLYAGTSETLTGSYADYSTVYTTNPDTGSAWTWAEVNDMEIGIGITGCSPGNEPFVTQVWAVVDYSGGAPSTNITFEVRAADTLSGGFPDASWVPVGDSSPITSGLPSGRYMQWRATLTTSDPSQTPILHEVRVYHY